MKRKKVELKEEGAKKGALRISRAARLKKLPVQKGEQSYNPV